MTKFTTHALTSCVPVCRSELLDEVTKTDNSEQVSRVWIIPGHVFVAVRNATKLLTFDCKPVIHHNSIGARTLDFPALTPSVVDIFMVQSSHITYIVQQNGHVHCWHFTAEFQWSSITEFDLCENKDTEVISMCMHPEHNTLYWCEHRTGDQSVYRICSKILPQDVEELRKKKQKASCVIVEECPASDVLPLDNGVLIAPRYKQNQIRVCIFWRPSVLELVSVATVIGSKVRDLHDRRSPLLFSDVFLNCIADLSEASDTAADFGVKKDITSGKLVMLHSDGCVYSFQAKGAKEEETSVSVSSIKISMPDQLLQCHHPPDAWSVNKNIIAIATQTNTVRLYDATEGHLIHELKMEGSVRIHSLATVHSSAILLGTVTTSGVTVVQGGKITKKAVENDTLPSDKHFQTDALQVALLTQQREDNPSQSITDQLSALHKKWKDLQAHQPRSQLSETVDTYLAEFWRLEEEANQLGKSQSIPSPAAHNTREMISDAVSRSRSMAPDAAMAELLWMAQKYPEDLLQVLLGDLNVEKEELTAEDQALWQVTLGLENADGHLNLQYSTITFELVCRLLYQQRPQSLVPFVRNAQTVSEQAVGVSAFVRRKHMQQYYMRAIECLPEPNNSVDPGKAASAKGQIILLGASDQGPELALRFLLRHSQWSEAISLLKQLGADTPQHTSLFFLLLQHLLQGQALSDYAPEVFSLLPSWKSFLPALKVMGDNSGGQCLTSSQGLFYSGSPDIPLSALRPHLMALLSSHPKQQQ
ncbi:BLOC-2 complex member HPS6-like [Littorina saxatilis]|uniref:BLOC-2 complex member HPS6-like n=1 Tax=Littorina saxatilis TaxID=31220 RepID=UPI0038B69DFC